MTAIGFIQPAFAGIRPAFRRPSKSAEGGPATGKFAKLVPLTVLTPTSSGRTGKGPLSGRSPLTASLYASGVAPAGIAAKVVIAAMTIAAQIRVRTNPIPAPITRYT